MKYENDLVDCGCSGTSWNTAYLYYNVVGNLNAMIVPYGKDSVTVTVNVFYKGIYKRYDANGKLIDFINADCQSTGKLERDFLFYITQ
jgi:hypothetical protein